MVRTLAWFLAAVVSVAAAPPGASGELVRVAILPVVIHSLEERSYLRDGLADMLAARLGQSPALAVIRIDDPERATVDPEAAQATARGADAEYVLFGSFTRFGDGASLDVQCVPAAKREEAGGRGIFIQSGTLAEIIPQLDGLAEKVIRYVTHSESERVESERPDPAVAASGPDALPSDAAPLGESSIDDALSEIDALRERLDRLEREVYGASEELDEIATPELDLLDPGSGFLANEEPDSRLR